MLPARWNSERAAGFCPHQRCRCRYQGWLSAFFLSRSGAPAGLVVSVAGSAEDARECRSDCLTLSLGALGFCEVGSTSFRSRFRIEDDCFFAMKDCSPNDYAVIVLQGLEARPNPTGRPGNNVLCVAIREMAVPQSEHDPELLPCSANSGSQDN